jgi:para-aminobenzoate synthetase component 1
MQSLQGFVLLRSHPKSAGRFDILAALPLASCRQLDCDDWIEQWPIVPQDSPWPFIGGVIGWVSYEACLSWHKLTKAQHTIHQLPPLELHYYPGAIIVDHHQQSVNLVWQDAHKDWADSLADAWHSPAPQLNDFEFSAPFHHCTPKTDYEQALQAISEFIRQGRVYQVNYTQAFTAPFKGDSFNFYQTTESRNPVAYGGFFKGLDYALMSFSPECFIQISNHKAITQPIKGTIGRSADPIEDKASQDWLLNSEKNRAENIMIVDLLRNDFSQ